MRLLPALLPLILLPAVGAARLANVNGDHGYIGRVDPGQRPSGMKP